MSALVLTEVQGWVVGCSADAVPRIRDLDLAERLGYARPRKIRDLIERLVSEEKMSAIMVRPTVGQTSGGRPGREYWLTREQAILVIAKSETETAYLLLNEVVNVFIAFLDGARPSIAHRDLIALTLRLSPAEAASVWSRELIAELERLYRKEHWNGREQLPIWLAFPMGRIWRTVLGDTAYAELKRRNPEPRGGSLHYQWLQEARHELVKQSDMGITIALAKQSRTAAEFWNRLDAHYGRAPLQLGFGG